MDTLPVSRESPAETVASEVDEAVEETAGVRVADGVRVAEDTGNKVKSESIDVAVERGILLQSSAFSSAFEEEIEVSERLTSFVVPSGQV
jgi:hypothetical protein